MPLFHCKTYVIHCHSHACVLTDIHTYIHAFMKLCKHAKTIVFRDVNDDGHDDAHDVDDDVMMIMLMMTLLMMLMTHKSIISIIYRMINHTAERWC